MARLPILHNMSCDQLRDKFINRRLLIATMHQKERVIAPILEKALGVQCRTLDSFDTDQFGSFSGEVERIHDPITTLRKKCLEALKKSNCDLVVGNEGSFGPHPTIGMIPADEEWMMLIDVKNKLEISAREISVDTNFNGRAIDSSEDLLALAARVKFPSHGIILRAGPSDLSFIKKGIQDQSVLLDTYNHLIQVYGQAFAETDMRALYNPTRMQVIKSLTQKLVRTLQSTCPKCKTPGFDVTEAIPGLPCAECGLKTRSALQHRYGCRGCGYQALRNFPNGKEQEDPMYCDFCNP